jgi:hypothetical protein
MNAKPKKERRFLLIRLIRAWRHGHIYVCLIVKMCVPSHLHWWSYIIFRVTFARWKSFQIRVLRFLSKPSFCLLRIRVNMISLMQRVRLHLVGFWREQMISWHRNVRIDWNLHLLYCLFLVCAAYLVSLMAPNLIPIHMILFPSLWNKVSKKSWTTP